MIERILFICIVIVLLNGCTNSFNEDGVNKSMNYAAFLKLMDVSKLSYEEGKENAAGFLSVRPNSIHIGNEQLNIYEYDSNKAMETDSGYVDKSGFSISRPGKDDYSTINTNISWVSNPYWFKKDLIIVNYVGTNERIINFLHENLDFFAGHVKLNDEIISFNRVYSSAIFDEQTEDQPIEIETLQSVSLINPDGITLKERFLPPEGFSRINAEHNSFAEFLQTLPLKPDGSKVMYFDGREKTRDVYLAVVDYTLGDRDLQQCADAVIRLRAEYFYAYNQHEKIRFNRIF